MKYKDIEILLELKQILLTLQADWTLLVKILNLEVCGYH